MTAEESNIRARVEESRAATEAIRRRKDREGADERLAKIRETRERADEVLAAGRDVPEFGAREPLPFSGTIPVVGYAGFEVKDSGARQEFSSGMVRDTTEGKVDYTLALDGPMFERYAEHLTKGAVKYSPRNWMQAEGQEELDRFRQSALRHFLQWYWGNVDEDHASAVFFNINGAEYVNDKMADEALAARTESCVCRGECGSC